MTAVLNKKTLLQKSDTISQEDIDRLMGMAHQPLTLERELEKGLSKEATNQLLRVMRGLPGTFTVSDITAQVSLSHVSIRKYLKLFEQEGWLLSHTEFGTIGRPTIYYRINPAAQIPDDY